MRYLLTFIIVLTFFSINWGQTRVKVIDGEVHHFGTIFKGEIRKHVFEIENVSKKTIHIDRVETSCGCTAALISSKKIKPKQRAKITAEFNSENFQGYQEKSIYVYEKKSNTPLVTLKIRINITVELDVVPMYLVFDNAIVGSDKKSIVQLINRTKEPIKIINVSNDNLNLKVKIDKQIINPEDAATIEGVFYPTVSGLTRGSVYVETNAKHQKKVEIKFYSNVRDKL